MDQLLLKAVADLHGPANLVERLASAGRLLGLLLLLAGVAYALLLIATHEMCICCITAGTLAAAHPFAVCCLLLLQPPRCATPHIGRGFACGSAGLPY